MTQSARIHADIDNRKAVGEDENAVDLIETSEHSTAPTPKKTRLGNFAESNVAARSKRRCGERQLTLREAGRDLRTRIGPRDRSNLALAKLDERWSCLYRICRGGALVTAKLRENRENDIVSRRRDAAAKPMSIATWDSCSDWTGSPTDQLDHYVAQPLLCPQPLMAFSGGGRSGGEGVRIGSDKMTETFEWKYAQLCRRQGITLPVLPRFTQEAHNTFPKKSLPSQRLLLTTRMQAFDVVWALITDARVCKKRYLRRKVPRSVRKHLPCECRQNSMNLPFLYSFSRFSPSGGDPVQWSENPRTRGWLSLLSIWSSLLASAFPSNASGFPYFRYKTLLPHNGNVQDTYSADPLYLIYSYIIEKKNGPKQVCVHGGHKFQNTVTENSARSISSVKLRREPLLGLEEVEDPVLSLDELEPSLEEGVPLVDDPDPVLPEDESVPPEDDPVPPEDDPVLPEDNPVLPEDDPVPLEDEPVSPEDDPVLFPPLSEPVAPSTFTGNPDALQLATYAVSNAP
ncbi:hypothetical protein B0H17DRAFT_1147132 [Mycena rosella]|uniref:Uncharacterized protein n=1 Tax=Mycena rosella TaxID=1033263 RepID=A0AAD7G2T6_MYCRO|nr:hypothetical protein B0H17DRAFT_1147132 [Mycena rosella]